MLDDVTLVGLFEGSLFQTDLTGLTVNEMNECLTLAILEVCTRSCPESKSLVKRRLRYKKKLNVEILSELKNQIDYAELIMAFSTNLIKLINKKREASPETLVTLITQQLSLPLSNH